MDKSRSAPLSAILDSRFANRVTLERVCAVAFRHMQARKIAHESRDAGPGSLDLDGHGNGVTVVFDEIKERQRPQTRRVQRLPEFAFACRAVSGGHADNLVRLKSHELPVRRLLGLREGLGMSLVIKRCLCCADRRRYCVPVGEDLETTCRRGWLQCDGICRPPDAGSSFAPTACKSMSSGMTPSSR